MEEKLKYILSEINEWLKFAEAKHAALIAFNGAVVLGLLGIFENIAGLPNIKIIFLIIALLIGLSLLFSFVSLIPKSNTFSKFRKNGVKTSINILLASDLSKISVQEFTDYLNQIDKEWKPGYFEKQLLDRILIHSDISARKYRLFNWAIAASLAGLAIAFGYLLVVVILI